MKISFLIVGTQKGGTSALDNHLRQHKSLQLAKRKEVHFFDKEVNFKAKADYKIYHASFNFSGNNKMYGECTPSYMYWNNSIKRIYQYNPNMKIIAVLRNPIYRAFSHWNMECNRNNEILPFFEAIEKEKERCRKTLPYQHRVYSYTDRGYYSKQIKRIWSFFPKEQTLFIKHDDFKNHLTNTLGTITTFLNIMPFEKVEPEIKHALPYTALLQKAEHAHLRTLYFEEIKLLEIMLGWNCSDWLKPLAK